MVAGIETPPDLSIAKARNIRGVSSRLSVLSIRCLKLSRLNSCCACGEGKCTRAHRALVGKSRQASTGDCD